MDLSRSFCCLLLTVVYKIDATNETYTWSQARNVCTLATPNLNFLSDGITPDLHNQLSADVWVGYVQIMKPFEYFGCAKKSDLNLDTADYMTEGDPGQCWSACENANAVAVYGNECHCLQTVNTEKLMKERCDRGCPNQQTIACGGYRKNTEYVSLYKTTFTGHITRSSSESNICLWYDKATTIFSWDNCTRIYPMLCYEDQHVWRYEKNHKFNYKSSSDWITMTTRCFEDGGIPSSYDVTKDVDTTEKFGMWTGIIRNDVVYKVTDSPDAMTGKYGYVSVKTGKLLFTNSNSETKGALCVEGGNSKHTTTTKDDDTNVQTATPSLTSKGTMIQQDTTGENTNGDKQSLTEESSNVGVIVGVTLTIIVVIIVAVVLVVLWKRGTKLPFIQKTKPEKRTKQATNLAYNVSRPDNNIQCTFESSTTEYAEVDVSKMSPGNKISQNVNINRISDSSDGPHTYFVIQNVEDGAYDTTDTSCTRQEQDTFNPYNRLNLEKASNYDHIGSRGQNHKETSTTDSPYNTTILGNSSMTHVGVRNNAYNKNDENEDTYNHIDGQLDHTGGKFTDNDYDTLKN
ncbi:hypothetical protein ACF0H5_000616 [Mactra antiquata]